MWVTVGSAFWLFSAVTSTDLMADDFGSVSARGVVRSVNEATLAADISARILKLPFRDGESFHKGDVLAVFDCERLQAELMVAEAEARGQRATYQVAANLLKQKAAGALEVAVAEAQSDKADAAVDVAKVRTRQCQIMAAFDGSVVELISHEQDTPAANAPLMRIVDHVNIEVELIVPSKWLAWLQPASPFSFHIDETGATAIGKISRIGSAIDPVSQTLKVSGVLMPESSGAGRVLPGMSGNALFSVPGG